VSAFFRTLSEYLASVVGRQVASEDHSRLGDQRLTAFTPSFARLSEQLD
jgi:hypothetical protein